LNIGDENTKRESISTIVFIAGEQLSSGVFVQDYMTPSEKLTPGSRNPISDYWKNYDASRADIVNGYRNHNPDPSPGHNRNHSDTAGGPHVSPQ
jgi:hypothetical protein